MPTYATLISFTAQELSSIGDPKKAYGDVIETSAQMGIKIIGAYATLGPHDLMLVYEAADEKAAASVAMGFGTKWYGRSETWTLIPMGEFIKLAAKLKD